ncbi:MAG TPA: hypothetical protein VN462_05900, partial [Negativicutes bacterium]|nr:hypothetical protein [Negativicutes bacterium]
MPGNKNKDEAMEKRKELLLARFRWSENWRRPWDDKWLRWYKAFRGIVPPLPEGEEDRSNLHIPYTYSTVDAVRSKLLTACFANRPYISFVPKDADDVESAHNMETLVDSQMNRADAEMMVRFYNLITDMLIYGGCPYETGWKNESRLMRKKAPVTDPASGILTGYEEIEEEVVLWDDPDFMPFMVDELYPDPEGTGIDDCGWVIRRRFISEKDLKAKMEDGIYQVKDLEELRSAGDTLSQGKQDRMAAIGASYYNVDQSEVGGRRFEILEMWEDDHVTAVINRFECVRDEDNPFWHGKKPFGFAKLDPLNGEFYGISLIEIIEYLQAELNTTRNQRIDSASQAINRMWFALKGIGLEPADLVSRPNGIIWVDNLEEAPKEVAFDPPPPAAYQEESIIKNDIQEATSTYDVVRGAQGDEKRTATENAIRERSTNIRFETKLKIFEVLGLKRLGFFFDQLNQQFIDDVRSVRLQGSEGGYEWQDMGPEDITGRFEYQPVGSSIDGTLEKMNYRDNLLRLYEVFAEDPEIKGRELKKRIFEAFDIKDVDKILKTEEEMLQEQQEAEQEMLQGILGGGAVPGGVVPG